jgi:hypothetical protein
MALNAIAFNLSCIGALQSCLGNTRPCIQLYVCTPSFCIEICFTRVPVSSVVYITFIPILSYVLDNVSLYKTVC